MLLTAKVFLQGGPRGPTGGGGRGGREKELFTGKFPIPSQATQEGEKKGGGQTLSPRTRNLSRLFTGRPSRKGGGERERSYSQTGAGRLQLLL